jgi:alpha-D-ribose 1-methylphosphonate 5-triphosphate diphosphatase PhnM
MVTIQDHGPDPSPFGKKYFEIEDKEEGYKEISHERMSQFAQKKASWSCNSSLNNICNIDMTCRLREKDYQFFT